MKNLLKVLAVSTLLISISSCSIMSATWANEKEINKEAIDYAQKNNKKESEFKS